MIQTTGHLLVNIFLLLLKLVSSGLALYFADPHAGAITAMLTNPIWVVKTRVFATPRNDPTAYRGLWGECLQLSRSPR